jgi:hypothetical protein
MIRRWLFACSLLPMAALAQIQVLQFDGTNSNPVGALVDVGSAAAGDTIETRFRARNIGPGPAVLQTLSLAGSGFRIASAPSLPYTIAPGSEAEFRVAFNPQSIGTYSAFLLVNTINITLRGIVAPSAVVALASGTVLVAGAAVDFGSLLRGASKLQSFTLKNPGSTSLTVNNLAVSGAGFRGPVGASAPIQLAAGQSVSFQVAFEPLTGTPAQGALTVDQRSFRLTGLGLDPPLPAASIVFGSTTGASAQQNSVGIALASASEVNGAGTLTMEFHPSVAGVADDAAVQFLSGPKRAATVTISAGDTAGKFGSQSSLAFQTGSTAGTIVFTLKLPNGTQQSSLTIAPSAVGLDSVHAVRRTGNLDVSLIGFDNTYSASQLAFTFLDANGTTMQPGVIRVDVTSDFRLYFSSTQVGGQFALLATFPVSGDVNLVKGVEVQVTNSAGVARSQRVNF